MTTIAYKDGVIAYDSRVTDGNIISDDSFDKCFVVDGVRFFLTGAVSDHVYLIDAYFKGKCPRRNIDSRAFVFDKGALSECAISPGTGFWRYDMRLDNPAAIGSGAQFALAAMIMGASAEEAVRVAARLDSCTGGTIRTFRLEEFAAQ